VVEVIHRALYPGHPGRESVRRVASGTVSSRKTVPISTRRLPLPSLFHPGQRWRRASTPHLASVRDRQARKVSARKLSSNIDMDFAPRVWKMSCRNTALRLYSLPVGGGGLRDNGVRIPLNGRGRWLDEAFFERLPALARV
jgi:hypothetical protein